MPDENQTILVTGGTGLLGAHLLRELVSQGYRVKAIRRERSSLKNVEKVFRAYLPNPAESLNQIEWLTGDVTDYYSLENAMQGVDKIFHLAGYISFEKKHHPKLEAINVRGTANVVNAALHMGVSRLVHVSSVTALGHAAEDGFISEKTPWKNTPENTHYAITKQAGEREVWRGAQEGLDVLVVNPALIIGYGDWHSGTGRVVHSIARGQKFYTEGVNGWIDVRDAVKAMLLLESAGIKNERFILSSENIPLKEAFDQMAEMLGSKKPYLKAGNTLLKLAAIVEKIKSKITGVEPLITPETAKTANLKSCYDNSKLFRYIDFSYTPFEETLREVTRLYKADMQRKG
jgi:nucleoside-diphosphate-sugar epimerase